MNNLLSIVTILMAVGLSAGSLTPSERSYKILMLLPVSSKSHRNVFLPLAEALLDRGHQVTMLSNHHLSNGHPKLEHYNHSLNHFREEDMNIFDLFKDESEMFKRMAEMFKYIAEEIHDDPIVQKIYNRRDEFDLFIIDSLFNEAMYPMLHEKTFITVSTGGLDPRQSAVQGNFLNPAYVSNLLFDYPKPYSFINRVKNIFFSVFVPYFWTKSITAPVQEKIYKRFPSLPTLLEIEANQSLALLNSHFSMAQPVPLLPTQVEIGCMHCKQGKALPMNLKDFLDGDQPVIYMSLGSVARSSTIPPEHKKTLMETFSKLPYKIIWKFEDDTLGKLPHNIFIMKWMPQQDILAHENVKAFISHCGLLGYQEAMYHATPLLCLPIGADQKKNAAVMENNYMGRALAWKDLTVPLLTDTINDVINNLGYKNKMVQVSSAFRDQLESPVERAVYWTEYVARHQGAPHLRSPEQDLSWIQLLHLDVIFCLHITMFVVLRTIKYLICLVTGKTKVNKSSRKSKSKRE